MHHAFSVRFVGRFCRLVFAAAWILGATLVAPAAAVAATLTYPGAAPCNTTLQACIDAAVSGDTVELAFDTANGESLSIHDKNLTLQPKPGNTPKVAFVSVVADAAAATVVVQNLAGIDALDAFCGKADLNVTVSGNTFASGTGHVVVRDNPGYSTGRITASIVGNHFDVSNENNGYDAISIQEFNQPFNASIVNNDLTLANLTQNGGISIYVGGGNGSNATIDRNRITGSAYDYGISLRTAGGNDAAAPASLLNATVTDNLIVGQSGNVGGPGGIVASASGWNGTIDVKIVNNTVVDGRTGIFAGAREDMGSAVKLGVFNNIVAWNSGYGIGADTSVALTSSNNLVFANGPDYNGPVPGTIVADPIFVNRAAKNYALGSGSPAIDRGLDAALPAQFTLDVAGNGRRAGTIDIGAYESGALEVTAAGVCGADNGLALTSVPTRLCSVGIAGPLFDSGSSWTWSCVGTGANATANCSAQRALVTAPALSPALLALLCGLLIALGRRARRA